MKTELAVLTLAVLLTPEAFGQFQYQQIFSFGPAEQSGASPNGLIEGSDGALYGTTSSGGITNVNNWDGFGTVFKVNKDGSGYTVLRSFTGTGGDGSNPQAALVEGSDGALYGTTELGGIAGDNYPYSMGTMFKLNKDGTGYAVIRRFTGSGGDGQTPRAALIEGSDGALYGTTQSGGIINADFSSGAGTVFRIAKDGSGYTVLYSFTVTNGDGYMPEASLLMGSDGALYGTTYGGNTITANWLGFGTVFRLNQDGSGYAVLHRFDVNDRAPLARLLEGSDGALYGTTGIGNCNRGGCSPIGTVFKLNKDGSGYQVLAGGSYRESGLVEGGDGALYGTTSEYFCHLTEGSGIFCDVGPGTVFKLNKDGSDYAVLRTFASFVGDGRYPTAGLLRGSDGAFYGTTQYGGDIGFGTIFVLRPQPVLLSPVILASGVIVRFTSVRGSTNQLQRAPLWTEVG